MEIFIRTQVVSIIFSLGWVVYINIITFLSNPTKRTIKYTDLLIWLLALILTIVYTLITRKYIGRKWLALPLVFLPYLLIYQFLFPAIQRVIGIGGLGYYLSFSYFSSETAHIMSSVVLISTLLGIILARKENI